LKNNMQTEIKIKDKTYRIDIAEMEEDLLRVKVNNRNYFFTKNKSGELISVDPNLYAAGAVSEENGIIYEALAEKEIKSPIAGVISSVDVKKGSKVKSGQKVATLIAMKMENEIIAETAGIIKEVRVKEKQFVNSGEILITLE